MFDSTPRNTSAADPLEHLVVAASSGGIEAQEAQGQRELLASTVLPVEGSENPRLLELGFIFGDKVPGDDLFRQATLPEGWSREGSDHSMHSYICDERGVRRVNVFYKAAFYDRRADMHLMNVGHSLSTQWIYGDEPNPTLPENLTAAELAAAHSSAESYLDDVARHPGIYGDREPLAKSLIAAIENAQVTA